MLSTSDRDLGQVAREFARRGVEATYFVPTATGLSKSIIDATSTVRRFLLSHGLHDFDKQSQGPSNKVLLDVDVIFTDRVERRTMSLYRPETKTGDPRFWIKGLPAYTQPGNLVAMFLTRQGSLAIANCSDQQLWATRLDLTRPLGEYLDRRRSSDAADELLAKLRDICREGFIESLREGPTGIGFTLESRLGIKANSSKSPDFKGIEIKSGRKSADTRTSLFSKTPNWKISALKNGGQILTHHGYDDPTTQRRQLYCSVAAKPNTQQLFLDVTEDDSLVEMLKVPRISVVAWQLEVLERTLAAKHRETFWVKAEHRRNDQGRFEFHFNQAIHTKAALTSNLGLLIDTGKVEMDLTLSRKPNGGTRDHGYLFKLWPQDLELLFPPPATYDLAA